mmetsp:Transcript_98294/g.153654  ORF Transcript_98294/g.153654 Transcript_98294/m.153654 type:complete len:107 (-) Transcript_98294:20-340(-)
MEASEATASASSVSDAGVVRIIAEIEKLRSATDEARFASDRRFRDVEERFRSMESRFDALDIKLQAVRDKQDRLSPTNAMDSQPLSPSSPSKRQSWLSKRTFPSSS